MRRLWPLSVDGVRRLLVMGDQCPAHPSSYPVVLKMATRRPVRSYWRRGKSPAVATRCRRRDAEPGQCNLPDLGRFHRHAHDMAAHLARRSDYDRRFRGLVDDRVNDSSVKKMTIVLQDRPTNHVSCRRFAGGEGIDVADGPSEVARRRRPTRLCVPRGTRAGRRSHDGCFGGDLDGHSSAKPQRTSDQSPPKARTVLSGWRREGWSNSGMTKRYQHASHDGAPRLHREARLERLFSGRTTEPQR